MEKKFNKAVKILLVLIITFVFVGCTAQLRTDKKTE